MIPPELSNVDPSIVNGYQSYLDKENAFAPENVFHEFVLNMFTQALRLIEKHQDFERKEDHGKVVEAKYRFITYEERYPDENTKLEFVPVYGKMKSDERENTVIHDWFSKLNLMKKSLFDSMNKSNEFTINPFMKSPPPSCQVRFIIKTEATNDEPGTHKAVQIQFPVDTPLYVVFMSMKKLVAQIALLESTKYRFVLRNLMATATVFATLKDMITERRSISNSLTLPIFLKTIDESFKDGWKTCFANRGERLANVGDTSNRIVDYETRKSDHVKKIIDEKANEDNMTEDPDSIFEAMDNTYNIDVTKMLSFLQDVVQEISDRPVKYGPEKAMNLSKFFAARTEAAVKCYGMQVPTSADQILIALPKSVHSAAIQLMQEIRPLMYASFVTRCLSMESNLQKGSPSCFKNLIPKMVISVGPSVLGLKLLGRTENDATQLFTMTGMPSSSNSLVVFTNQQNPMMRTKDNVLVATAISEALSLLREIPGMTQESLPKPVQTVNSNKLFGSLYTVRNPKLQMLYSAIDVQAIVNAISSKSGPNAHEETTTLIVKVFNDFYKHILEIINKFEDIGEILLHPISWSITSKMKTMPKGFPAHMFGKEVDALLTGLVAIKYRFDNKTLYRTSIKWCFPEGTITESIIQDPGHPLSYRVSTEVLKSTGMLDDRALPIKHVCAILSATGLNQRAYEILAKEIAEKRELDLDVSNDILKDLVKKTMDSVTISSEEAHENEQDGAFKGTMRNLSNQISYAQVRHSERIKNSTVTHFSYRQWIPPKYPCNSVSDHHKLTMRSPAHYQFKDTWGNEEDLLNFAQWLRDHRDSEGAVHFGGDSSNYVEQRSKRYPFFVDRHCYYPYSRKYEPAGGWNGFSSISFTSRCAACGTAMRHNNLNRCYGSYERRWQAEELQYGHRRANRDRDPNDMVEEFQRIVNHCVKSTSRTNVNVLIGFSTTVIPEVDDNFSSNLPSS